ncbi:hypothetical protein SAMN05216480_103232 [Pustulibacterium marinum]|uniref:CarboxypepD_reg-like domain-containing protein n=1 Tax=Pustulibacterium marinum TaxID=1224947 RepID=A0A1I7G6E0_9FLAO|nr:hypothetical protein [Pustulibacterium marinum]SFU44007.1 hypothetical protein SAMN05216480_103232 [Pustulibacterium marinum]
MNRNFTYYTFYILIFFTTLVFSQTEERVPLRGQVIYKNINISDESVINVTNETVVMTDSGGQFVIDVKPGDILAFTSLNYELASVEVTQDIIDNGRLIVEVDEKINELDEVVITPENTEKFLNAKSEQLSSYGEYSYERDDATEIKLEDNEALPIQVRGLQNGLNFTNIARVLFKGNKETSETSAAPKLNLSEIVLQLYDKEFFVVDLKIPKDKIKDFTYYLDDQSFSRDLLQKDNEFQFVDYLINQSKEYRKTLSEE